MLNCVINNKTLSNMIFKAQRYKYKMNNKSDAELIKDNVRFKNVHLGERCFILGNGPSIKNVDLSLLKEEFTFTVNQMSRLHDFDKLETNYHMFADERFFDIDEARVEDLESLEYMKRIHSTNSNPIVFFKTNAYQMIKKYKLEDYLQIAYFSDFCGHYPSENFDLNFDDILPRYSTVVHYLIVLAVYMGFTNIYLLGCDCTGILNTVQSLIDGESDMAYAYEVSENERKRMKRSNSVLSIQDELRSYANIFDCYELLNHYCEAHGAELINLTDGSLLTSVKTDNLTNVI